MSDLLQFVIVAGFGALCFGCGYLIAFIVTRNRWRDEMIKRGVARYNWQNGKRGMGRATETIEILDVRSPLPAAVVGRSHAQLFMFARANPSMS